MAAEIRGRSFGILADVTVDTTGAEGVLFKQGGAHGGHVLFIRDDRLHYVYNFLDERQQLVSSSCTVPLGRHLFGASYARTGTVPNSHTPLGDVTLFIDDEVIGTLAEVITHPGAFGLVSAGITVGRNGGSGVSSCYKVPSTFTGGSIAAVTVDLSGRPYIDVEPNLHLPFRATERARRARSAATDAAGTICVLTCVAVVCGKSMDGKAVRACTTSSTANATTTSGAPRRFDPTEPVPGIETTLPAHIPPNALVCFPPPNGNGRMTPAAVSDPVAPKLTVPIPDGWNSAPGTVALTATDPDGLSLQVTISSDRPRTGRGIPAVRCRCALPSRMCRTPSPRHSSVATAASLSAAPSDDPPA